MRKSTLLMWCTVAFLLALYWDATGHPKMVWAVAFTVTPLVLAVLSVRWGLPE